MRILGIDYGDVRVGLAVSDPTGFLASGIGNVVIKGMNDAVEKVTEKIKEVGAEKIVLGLPKNMDNSEGFRVKATREFAEILKAVCPAPIEFWDERLTTTVAIQTLNETNVRGKKRKEVIDTVAATYILQGFLDKKF